MTLHFQQLTRRAGRNLATATIAVLVLAASAQVQAADLIKVKFSLEWLIQGPTAPYLLAQERGYFAKEGLDVTIDAGSGSTAFIQRLSGGAYDFAVGDLTTYIEYLSGNPTQDIMRPVYVVQNQLPSTVFALAKSGIKKPADLAGKRVAAATFAATKKLWPLFARANGLDANNISWQSVDPSLREAMLTRGQVDAVAGFLTDLPAYDALGIRGADLVAIKFAEHGVQLYSSTIFASKRILSERPNVVAAFLRALNLGMKEAMADPDAAIKYVMKRNPLLNEAQERQRLELARENILTKETRQYGYGAAQPARLAQQVSDALFAFGLQNKPASDKVFEAGFLPPLADRLPK